MTYEYKGLVFRMTFIYDRRKHPRLDEERDATTLRIESPTGIINIEQTFFSNPEKPLPSKEFRRAQVIGKFKPHMPRSEYVAMRRAYFLRPRKTQAMKKQTRAFNRELKRLIADADLPDNLRTTADELRVYLERLHAPAEKFLI